MFQMPALRSFSVEDPSSVRCKLCSTLFCTAVLCILRMHVFETASTAVMTDVGGTARNIDVCRSQLSSSGLYVYALQQTAFGLVF